MRFIVKTNPSNKNKIYLETRKGRRINISKIVNNDIQIYMSGKSIFVKNVKLFGLINIGEFNAKLEQ